MGPLGLVGVSFKNHSVLVILVVVLVACSIVWGLIKRLLNRIVPAPNINQVVALEDRLSAEAEASEIDSSEAVEAANDDRWAPAPLSHPWSEDLIRPNFDLNNETQF